jgi:hypothetical protein
MEAIGYQGFFSERRVIDLAGLVSPAVVKLRAQSNSNAETFYKILSVLRPDYIVPISFEFEQNEHVNGGPLFDNEEQREFFIDSFRELRRFSAPFPEEWGRWASLTVYGRFRPRSSQLAQ